MARHDLVVGDRAEELARSSASGQTALELLPDARFFPGIAAQSITHDTTPLYGRAPDAKRPQ